MNTYYITFGSNHLIGFGLHYYIKCEAPNELIARKKINELTNNKWSGIYTEIPKHNEKCLGILRIFDEYLYECIRVM